MPQIPRRGLGVRLKGMNDLVLRPFAPDNAALALLRAYLEALEAPQPGAPEVMAPVVAEHVHQLLALATEWGGSLRRSAGEPT